VLQQLVQARTSARHGLSLPELAQQLRVDPLQLEPVLEILVGLDWVGRVNEIEDEEKTRYLLLADPALTPLQPLLRQLLLSDSEATAGLWNTSRLANLSMRDVVA
jgi:membrane protein